MSEEFEARAGAPQQPPQEGAEEQEKLPQEELFYWLQTLVTAIVCIVLVFTFLGRITRVVGHSMDDTLADGELLAHMRNAGQPWAVSSLAQAAGIAALEQGDYVERVRALVEEERPYLMEGMRALGLRVIAGRANYLLFRAAKTLGEEMEKRGVVLRGCGNYPGLDDTWYRTAVRTREENDILLQTLREVLG